MQHTHEIPLSTFGYASLAEVKFRGGLPGAGRQAQPRDVLQARGDAAVSDRVFVRDGLIEGLAPALTVVTIDI